MEQHRQELRRLPRELSRQEELIAAHCREPRGGRPRRAALRFFARMRRTPSAYARTADFSSCPALCRASTSLPHSLPSPAWGRGFGGERGWPGHPRNEVPGAGHDDKDAGCCEEGREPMLPKLVVVAI